MGLLLRQFGRITKLTNMKTFLLLLLLTVSAFAQPFSGPYAVGGGLVVSTNILGALPRTNSGVLQMSPVGGNNQILDMQTAISSFQGQIGVSYAGNLTPWLSEANGIGTGTNVWGLPINMLGSPGDIGLRTLTPILGTPTGGTLYTNDVSKVFTLNSGGANYYFNGNSNAMSRDRAIATNSNGSIITQADTGLYIHNLCPFSSGSFLGLPMYSATPTNMFGTSQALISPIAGGGSNYLADPFGLVMISIPNTDPIGETNQAPGYFLIGGITPFDMGLSYNMSLSGETVVHQHSWLYSYASQAGRTDGYGSAGHWLSGFPLQVANAGVPTNVNWKWALVVDEFTGDASTTNGTFNASNIVSRATNGGAMILGHQANDDVGAMLNVNGGASFNNVAGIGSNTFWTFDGAKAHRFAIGSVIGQFPKLIHGAAAPFALSRWSAGDISGNPTGSYTDELVVDGTTGNGTFTTDWTVNGNLITGTVGKGLQVKGGSNAKIGTVVLNGTSAVVVTDTAATANSQIILTIQTPAGTVGSPYVSAISAGTSFSVKSTAVGDTSTAAYLIVEKN